MMNAAKYYLPGAVLIALAVTVTVIPEILVGLVAAFMVVMGISALHIGHRIRKHPVHMAYQIYDHRYMNSPFFRVTAHRSWF